MPAIAVVSIKGRCLRLFACQVCGAKPVFGDGGRGVEGERGFFFAPVLLEAADAAAAGEVHRREVFGPLATLLPYSGDPAEAAAIVALGQGSLVSSVYTDDLDVAAEVALGIAPYNGRVNIGGAKTAGGSGRWRGR